MFEYETYKVLHLSSIFLYLGGMGASFFSQNKEKLVSILTGIAGLLILVGGMGLLARIGVNHGEPFPTWVILKFVVWGVLAILGPVLAKRLKGGKVAAFYLLMIVAIVGSWIATNKPEF